MSNGYRSRCGVGGSLRYAWFDDAELSLFEVSNLLASQFANDALRDGFINELRKDDFEDDLAGFIEEKLDFLCEGCRPDYVIDVPVMCQRARLPIFEHRWRYHTLLYKSYLHPLHRERTLQIRHYVGEPEVLPDLLVGLSFHVKPWPHEDRLVVNAEQDVFIQLAIDNYQEKYSIA